MKKYLTLGILELLIIGTFPFCSNPTDNSNNTNNQMKSLNLSGESFQMAKSLGFSKSSNTVSKKKSLITYIQDLIIKPAFASDITTAESHDLLQIDESGTVSDALTIALPIVDFAIPPEKIESKIPIILSGDFTNISTTSGETISCNVIWIDPINNKSVCLYTITDDESPLIPVTTTREGNVDGYYSDNYISYWVINNISGGYHLYRYDGSNISIIIDSSIGQITNLIAGDKSIFGYDAVNNNGQAFYGNPTRGIDKWTMSDLPGFYDGYIFFNTTGQYGPSSFFINLDNATGTSFVQEFSIDARSPSSDSYIANHSYGAFWITSDTKKLCEVFKFVNRPETIGFRYIDNNTWVSIAISDDFLGGIVNFGSGNRLVICSIEPGIQALGSSRTLNLSVKESTVNIDSITSISRYSNGFIIKGIKDNVSVVRYWNTKISALETLESEPVELLSVIDLPH